MSDTDKYRPKRGPKVRQPVTVFYRDGTKKVFGSILEGSIALGVSYSNFYQMLQRGGVPISQGPRAGLRAFRGVR